MSEQSRRIDGEQKTIKRHKEWLKKYADRLEAFIEKEWEVLETQEVKELRTILSELRKHHVGTGATR